MLASTKKVLVFLCAISMLGISWTTAGLAHNITFNTDFNNPAAGPGTILDQSTINPARIFQYSEDDVFATAIRDLDSESHYHLFGNGILIGGDSEGVQFTFGGADPTSSTLFNVESLEVLDLGTVNTFFTPFMGSTAGPSAQVTSLGTFNFDPATWSGISHFVASFETPLTQGSNLTFTNLDVHQASTNPVPEPSTLGLFGTGLAGLWYMRRKNRLASQTVR